MNSLEIKNLLLVGFDLVALAKSAKSAGFKVFAIDYFGDFDLAETCDKYKAIMRQVSGQSCGKIENQFNPKVFPKLARELLRETSADAILLSSGLDDSFETLEELDDLVPILGNKPKIFRRVRNKAKFFNEIKRLGLPHPETQVVENMEEARKAAKDIGYPVVVKPSSGFAGTGIRKAENLDELKNGFKIASLFDKNVVVQEYLRGVHASVSLISSSGETKVLTVNEQLLGLKELGQKEPFGFCGNIVPFIVSGENLEKCIYIAKKVASHFNLKGSNGIDIVFSHETGGPYLIEVNPRFQATLECVERSLNLNLVKLHIKACLGEPLPNIPRKIEKYCTRLILFAKQRVKASDLAMFKEVRDIPFPGVIIEEGEPLCSVIAEAKTRDDSFRKAMKIANSVYERFTTPI